MSDSQNKTLSERLAIVETKVDSINAAVGEMKKDIKEFLGLHGTISNLEIAVEKNERRIDEVEKKIYRISIFIAVVFTGLGVGIDKVLRFFGI